MATIRITSGPDRGTEHPLQSTQVIGRLARNAIPIQDAAASREHARIDRTDQGWMLTDLQSTNGIIIDRQRVAQAALRHGSSFLIGESLFEIVDEERAAAPAPPSPAAAAPQPETRPPVSATPARPAPPPTGPAPSQSSASAPGARAVPRVAQSSAAQEAAAAMKAAAEAKAREARAKPRPAPAATASTDGVGLRGRSATADRILRADNPEAHARSVDIGQLPVGLRWLLYLGCLLVVGAIVWFLQGLIAPAD